jgi:alpha-glucosidase
MQAGVFFPILRSHSSIGATPRFPWLYGPDAEAAIHKALDLRYQLVPYFYSLAHESYETGAPLMRPLVMEFPDDPKVAKITDQWLVGPGLMVAPALVEGGKRHVYFPDTMFAFNDSTTFTKGQEIELTAKLDEIPIYVRAGTILPLGPVVQNTGQLPGGPLEVQVYPGKDASFTLVEDDGASFQYQTGAVRKTAFTWKDATQTLSWIQSGTYAGKDVFQKMHITVFTSAGKKERDETLSPSGNMTIN